METFYSTVLMKTYFSIHQKYYGTHKNKLNKSDCWKYQLPH